MPFRSLLFTPASRLDRLPKALGSGADWIALDLEDGVGPDQKNDARRALNDLAGGGFGGDEGRIAVRINTLSSPDGIRDIGMMLAWTIWPALVILPKVSALSEVLQVLELAASCGQDPALLVTLETAAGVASADQIARVIPKASALAYGSADHMAETGGEMSAASLAWARGQIVNAAALAGIAAMDGVWLDYRDTPGLEAEANLVKSMGFAGKIAIHPDQVATINKVFSPTGTEIETAQAMLAASDAAGGGAFSYNGKMVDAPVLARARRIVDTLDSGSKK